MTDPTLSAVDDEPWNNPPRQASAPVIPIETALPMYERIMRGLPILANSTPAEYVYHVSDQGWVHLCFGCKARCALTAWQEWQYAPNDKVARKHRREYIVGRKVWLCNTCSGELKRCPLGQRWEKSR